MEKHYVFKNLETGRVYFWDTSLAILASTQGFNVPAMGYKNGFPAEQWVEMENSYPDHLLIEVV